MRSFRRIGRPGPLVWWLSTLLLSACRSSGSTDEPPATHANPPGPVDAGALPAAISPDAAHHDVSLAAVTDVRPLTHDASADVGSTSMDLVPLMPIRMDDWTGRYIGSPAKSGTFSFDGAGALTITAQGAQLNSHGGGTKHDSFFFVSKKEFGDLDFFARLVRADCVAPVALKDRYLRRELRPARHISVDALEQIDFGLGSPSFDFGMPTGQPHGLMIREEVNPDARFIYVGMETVRGVTTYDRDMTGSGHGIPTRGGEQVRPPVWLRLQRRGATIVPAYSVDGRLWKNMASPINIDFANGFFVGFLAGPGYSDDPVCTAVFDDVNVWRR